MQEREREEMTVLFITIYVTLFILTAALGANRRGLAFAPQMWFSGLWCIVGILSNLGIYDFYKPSLFVNLTIIAGIVLFDIASFLLINMQARDLRKIVPDVLGSRLNLTAIYIVNAACLLFLLPTLFVSLSYIAAGDFTALRTAIFANEFTSTLQNAVRSYLINPIVTATVLVGLVSFFLGKEKGAQVLVVGLIGCFAITMAEASRVMLTKTVTFLIIAAIVAFKKGGIRVKLNLRSKLFIFFALVASVGFCLVITNDRSADGDFLKVFYTYYFAGPSYLTQLLACENSAFTVFEDFLLGGASFGGFVNIPIMVLTYLGFGVKDTTFVVGSVLTSGNLAVSPTMSLNSMCTCFFDFFVDWGYLGIVVGPILLAVFTALIVNSYSKKRTVAQLALLVFWFYILTRTPFALDTINPAFVITMVCIFVFCREFRGPNANGKKSSMRC